MNHETGHVQGSSIPARVPTGLVWLALLVALLATLGSLWLSVGMNLKACPLCFYQRTFAMSVLGVLAIGIATGASYRMVLPVLALPMALGGCIVAGFHVYLELTGKLECPLGVLGIGTAPQQSLAILALLLVLVAIDVLRAAAASGPSLGVACLAVAIGAVFASGAIVSSPPLPATPTKAYEAAPEICRPPYAASRAP